MGDELQQLDEAEQDDGMVGLQERGIGLRRLDDEFFPHAVAITTTATSTSKPGCLKVRPSRSSHTGRDREELCSTMSSPFYAPRAESVHQESFAIPRTRGGRRPFHPNHGSVYFFTLATAIHQCATNVSRAA